MHLDVAAVARYRDRASHIGPQNQTPCIAKAIEHLQRWMAIGISLTNRNDGNPRPNVSQKSGTRARHASMMRDLQDVGAQLISPSSHQPLLLGAFSVA